MGPDVQAVLDRPMARNRDAAAGAGGVLEMRPCLFLARASEPEEPRRLELPKVVALSRARVFDLAADAHAVSRSLQGLGLEPQVAMLDRMRSDLEACLAEQALL